MPKLELALTPDQDIILETRIRHAAHKLHDEAKKYDGRIHDELQVVLDGQKWRTKLSKW